VDTSARTAIAASRRAAVRVLDDAIAGKEREKAEATRQIDAELVELRAERKRVAEGFLKEPSGNVASLFGEPPQPRPKGKLQRTVYEIVLANKAASLSDITKAVYGDEATRNNYENIRAATRAMKDSGWLDGESGAWVPLDGQKGEAA